jgi:hypothetical protein
VTQPGKKGRFCLDPTLHITRSRHQFGSTLQPRPPPDDPALLKPKYKSSPDSVPVMTSKVGSSPDGALYDLIPDAGEDGVELMNPKLYQSSAFKCFLLWNWRLCLEYPEEDILLLADDISATFNQVLHHPRISLVFCSVLIMYLIIPTALIFGTNNLLLLYMIPEEVRAHIAATLHELNCFVAPLALSFPTPLNTQQCWNLVEAIPDSFHAPLSASKGARQSSFVDNKGNVQVNTVASMAKQVQGTRPPVPCSTSNVAYHTWKG